MSERSQKPQRSRLHTRFQLFSNPLLARLGIGGLGEGRQRRPWRLRTRLGLSLLLLFLAVFGLIVFSRYQYLSDRRDSRIDGMQSVNRTVASVFDGFRRDLESFALSAAVTLGDKRVPIDQAQREDSPFDVASYLQRLADSYGIVRAVFITDPEGSPVYSSEEDFPSSDVSAASYIQPLRQGRTGHWSGSVPGFEPNQTFVMYSRAIVDPDGVTSGFIVFAIQAEQLADRLPAELISPGHVNLIDHNGSVFFRLPDDGVQPPAILNGWQPLEEARGGKGVLLRNEAIPLDQEDRYGSLVPLPRLGWVLGYTLPTDAIEGGTTGLFLRQMAVFGAILLAAFGVTLFIANRLAHPFSRLARAAQAITRGESPADLTADGWGDAEAAFLADTMEQMRRAIEARERQLRVQASVLESIEHIGESLASELRLEPAIDSIMETSVNLIDAEAAQFLRAGEDGKLQNLALAGPQPSLALSPDDPLVREVLSGARVHIADLPSRFGRTRQMPEDGVVARSVLGVPIRSRSGEVEGALFLLRSGASVFTGRHQRLALGLARWSGIVLENAKLYTQSQEVLSLLQQANAAKDEFLGIVAHELRTPITTIYGGARLLRLRRDNLPPQSLDDMIVSISEESERLYLLVEDLLAIARTETADHIEREPVIVSDTIEDAIARFSTTQDRVIELDVQPDLPLALADATYVRQVITNLLSNAQKYTPNELPVEVTASNEEGRVVVRVMDNGPGVEDSELPRIFDSFYRSGDAMLRAGGSGLGLTVCKRLVESLNGHIWAKNRPQGGLEVGFALEAVTQQEEAHASS